jgi:5-methylcytosine-specific restriction protein A
METAEIPPTSNFEFGAQHLRKELHDEFAGQRQYGISTPSANSFMFVFTDPR